MCEFLLVFKKENELIMIHDENRMLFMTVANKSYQKYIPWFLYFLNRAYPKAHKLILLDETIMDNIKQMLTLLSGNFEIRQKAFPEYTRTNANTIKCLRWLVFEPTFEQYDCMSIGDIDMAIYAETPSYMDQHLSHCDLLGIPYSNFLRPTQPRRMGGIHVIKPREWFSKLNLIMEKYRLMFKEGRINLPEEGFNEQLLLKMILESELGEPPDNLFQTYWSFLASSNHHGTHIRLAEHGGIRGIQSAKGYRTHKAEVLAAVETSVFKQLVVMSPKIGSILVTIAEIYKNF